MFSLAGSVGCCQFAWIRKQSTVFCFILNFVCSLYCLVFHWSIQGEKSFFLLPGEKLEQGIQDVFILGEDEGLILKANEAFMDIDGKEVMFFKLYKFHSLHCTCTSQPYFSATPCWGITWTCWVLNNLDFCIHACSVHKSELWYNDQPK